MCGMGWLVWGGLLVEGDFRFLAALGMTVGAGWGLGVAEFVSEPRNFGFGF